jgi:hypothetical protein
MKIYTPSDFSHRNITPSYCHASCSRIIFFGEQSDIPLPSSAGETHTPTINIKFIHHTFAIASSAAVAAQ